MIPRRNEIWWFGLRRDARGTELAAGREARPGLVISLDEINDSRKAITIALITSFPFPRCDWSPECSSNHSPYRNISHYEHRETRLPRVVAILHKEGEPDAIGGHVYKVEGRGDARWARRTIVDCAALYTLPVPDRPSQKDVILWDRGHARLEHPLAIENVHSALQAIIGGGISVSCSPAESEVHCPSVRALQFQTGDILQLSLPNQQPNRRCLVVSSSSIDFLREHLYLKNGAPPVGREQDPPRPWPLGHLTVVPVSAKPLNLEDPTCLEVVAEDKQKYGIHCAELYTVDWRARTRIACRLTGLNDDWMARVRHVIRYSLGLPS